MKPLTNAVRLWMSCLDLRVLNVIDRQIKLIIMGFSFVTLLRATVEQTALRTPCNVIAGHGYDIPF